MPAVRAVPSAPVITITSRHSCGGGMLNSFGSGTPATGASPWSDAANCIMAFPFQIERITTFYKGFWVNGSAAGGNSEVGIYDAAFNKLVTTGSVAGSGNSVPQSAALSANTTLSPGLYYGIMAHSATTTNQVMRWSITTAGVEMWRGAGCWKQAGITLGSLPAAATPVVMTNIAFPLFGLITRSNFAV